MRLSRAGFLKRFTGEVLAGGAQLLPVVLPNLTTAIELLNAETHSEPGATWVAVGFLNDFPPDCCVKVNKEQHLIFANRWGLYALDAYQPEQSPRRPLRLACNGQLELCPGGQWPEKAYLSILTGNRLIQEDSLNQ